MSKMVLFDTNILVYAHHQKSSRQIKAQKVIRQAMDKGTGAVSWQNLLEFYNVITDKRKVSHAVTASQAEKIISDYQRSNFFIIHPDDRTYKLTVTWAKKLSLVGKQRIFDALIVATMKQHNIETIYTNDEAHFDSFADIYVVNPFK